MFTNLIRKNFLMLNETSGGYDTGYNPTEITQRDIAPREHLSFNGGTYEIEPTLSVMQPLEEPIHNFPKINTDVLSFEPDFVSNPLPGSPVNPSTLPINFGNTDTEINPQTPTYLTTREGGTAADSLINSFNATPEQQQQQTTKKNYAWLLVLLIAAAAVYYIMYASKKR